MAARFRGLRRAVGVSPRLAWRRVYSEAGGHVKAEYDAVVIGAGNAEEPQLKAVRQPALRRGLGGGMFTETHRLPLPWAHLGQKFGRDGARGPRTEGSLVWESGACNSGAGSALGLLCAEGNILALSGLNLTIYNDKERAQGLPYVPFKISKIIKMIRIIKTLRKNGTESQRPCKGDDLYDLSLRPLESAAAPPPPFKVPTFAG